MAYTIQGTVKDTNTGEGAAGVRVEAWDKDNGLDDFLGKAITAEDGTFTIKFSEYLFWELFTDFWPDLYFKVYYEGELLLSTEDSVLWNVRHPEHVDLEVALPEKEKEWIDRHIYLKIERIEDYSPVQPQDKTPPPIQYGRDCMRNEGHPDGVIPDSEIEARALDAVVYREYLDAGYLFPKTDKIIQADINEPVYNHRVPGTVIYTYPCERLHIHVWNCDEIPHSFHTHGFRYGIDSDGAWPFGTESEDGQRSDEICPGQTWTYTFEVDEDMIGVWPFHDHTQLANMRISSGLFGGFVVLRPGEKPPGGFEVVPPFFERLKDQLIEAEGRDHLHVLSLKQNSKVLLRDQLEFLEEVLVKEHVRPWHRVNTDHVPVFFHHMFSGESKPLFDSGDLEELVGVYEHTFDEEGDFEYFCTHHPTMTGMVHVMAGGPALATVNIVDGPPMAFSPNMVTVGVGGTVRWENHSIQHHTVTSKDGASVPTHCINGRGFVGNSPTIVAPSGQRIRWYVFNLDTGTDWHNFHPHAMRWKFAGENIDIRSLGPAESFMVDTEVPPVLLLDDDMKAIQDPEHRPKDAKLYHLKGDYVFHCHVHHHLMNGMVGVVRAKQNVWLTEEMAQKLREEKGLALDDGKNTCPDVDVDRCRQRGEGQWEEIPGDPEVTFMHSVLLPNTEKVLYWGYTRLDQSRLWDPTGGYSAPANQPADLPGLDENTSDLWSAEHTHLDTTEGLVLAHGGFTPNRSFIFDPTTETWSQVQDTTDDRFYSTTLTIADGRALTLFGSASKSIEAYTHGVGWAAPVAMPPAYNHHVYYPWTYLLPDGQLFIAGPHDPTQRFDWTNPAAFDSFSTIAGNRSTGGEKGTSVMQILRPPDYKPIVIIAGGNTAPAQQTAEYIDLSAAAPAWMALPNLNVARAQQFTSVLMPDGRIFIAGGVSGGPDGGVCEIYDPQNPGAGWQVGPAMQYVRTYHSSIILLADGSILAGGDPQVAGVPTPHERYVPDYFTVPRPTITNAPATINYGGAFTIDTPDAASINEAVLLRPGAVTHGFNMGQRGIELVITGGGANSIDVEEPPQANLAPPGWHLLFILDGNRTPSVGRWIRLTP